MKKTLVAVAALAASAAFAQSSVTLYGVADAYFGSEKGLPVAPATTAASQTVVNSGGLSESRLGVSVKEDLGAGLSAFAVIEQGVNLDQGNSKDARSKSVVGLSGDFGAVSLGKQFTPTRDAIEGTIDAQSNSAFSAIGAVRGARNGSRANATVAGGGYGLAGRLPAVVPPAVAIGGDSYNNSVRYDSPNFDGFSGAIQVGFGENKTATSAGRGVSLNLSYANGPVAVVFAHQNDKTQGGAPTLTEKLTALGGSYDFGVAKLNLGYARDSRTNANSVRTVNVGVAVPVDAFTFVAQYAQNKESKVSGNARSFALEGRYALSKRTTAYAGYNNTRDTINSPATAVKTNRFGVGLRHVF